VAVGVHLISVNANIKSGATTTAAQAIPKAARSYKTACIQINYK